MVTVTIPCLTQGAEAEAQSVTAWADMRQRADGTMTGDIK